MAGEPACTAKAGRVLQIHLGIRVQGFGFKVWGYGMIPSIMENHVDERLNDDMEIEMR